MRTIYIDRENRCHVADDGSMTAVETDFFDGACDELVEGYCYEAENHAVYPWKPYSQLMAAQREYDRARLADAEAALAILLGGDAV